MKKYLFSAFTLFLLTTDGSAQTLKSSPSALAQVVVDVLEEVRDSLKAHSLEFTQAELEVSATRKLSAGAEVEVWVVNGNYDWTKETSLTLSYALLTPLDKAKKETDLIASTDVMYNGLTATERSSRTPIKAVDKNLLETFSFMEEQPDAVLKVADYSELFTTVDRIKKRRKDSYTNAKDVLVKGILGALAEHKRMEQLFGDVCFDVSIGFEVEQDLGGGVKLFKIVSAKGSKTTASGHSLKLAFGECK